MSNSTTTGQLKYIYELMTIFTTYLIRIITGKPFNQPITNLFHYNYNIANPTPVILPGKSHGQRSLVGCSPWGRSKSDTAERLHFHFSLSCIGEGNGNPLQCSCLESPRDGGDCWAAVYGVTQSWTLLKGLSSSSSSSNLYLMYLKSPFPVYLICLL